MKKYLLIAYISSMSVSHAATVAEASQALLAGDTAGAIRLAEGIRAQTGQHDEDWSAASLILAKAKMKAGQREDANILLKRIAESAGIKESVAQEAVFLRIGLSSDTTARRKLCEDFLRRWSHGEAAAAPRLMMSKIIEKTAGDAKALEFLRSRPASERGAPFDAPLAKEETRLASLPKDPPKDSESAGNADLARGEALFKRGKFAEAAKVFEATATAHYPPQLRRRAFAGRLAAMEADGQGIQAASLVGRGLVGISADSFEPEHLALFAHLKLTYAGDAVTAESFARRALESLKSDMPEAEDTRWILARAIIRLGRPESEVREALKDSPAVRESSYAPDSPHHPVSRLITAGGNLDRWIEQDLHQSAPAGATPTLRAADECFAATRFDEAAKLYERAAKTPGTTHDIRAYATLQRARALAQLRKLDHALAAYRRFLTDKDLVRSAYAPGALLRAGVLTAGPMGKPMDALPFYEAAFREHPKSEPGETAAVYRVAILELFAPERVKPAIDDYLKQRPDGRFAADLRKKISAKKTTLNPTTNAKK